MAPLVIDSNQELFARYRELSAGDIILGRIRMAPGQEHILLDLQSRGVHMLPSAMSQLCSRSKVFQAEILAPFMAAHTRPVYSMQDMLETVTAYGRARVGNVICKLDRANGGTGILRFSSIEDVFTQASLGSLGFPFVVQPFFDNCRDVRVVILGGMVEAYQRCNPDNFRHNLHCGGKSTPFELNPEQLDFCRAVMARAGFPYAHVDLLILPDDSWFLSEINLRGGLRGARIDQQEYLRRVAELQEAELAALLGRGEK
jgi:ribosomal protein S6--L-glutamate ligase